jgi:hypothetical protein
MRKLRISRRRYARWHVDRSIHQALAAAPKQGGIREALEHLVIHARCRSNLLRGSDDGGRAAWNDVDWLLGGLKSLAHARADWLRDAADWHPLLAGKWGQFAALAEHLLARAPMPLFMALVWLQPRSRSAIEEQKWYKHLAHGQNVRGTDVPVRLTRPMASAFAAAPAHFTVAEALRRAQAIGLGADEFLARAVAVQKVAIPLTNMHFRAGGKLAHGCAADLLRELRFRFAATRVLRPPRARRSKAKVERWPATGIAGFRCEERRQQAWMTRVWTIRELRDSRELAAEGEAMHHCVAQYSRLCAKRISSIWSLASDDATGANKRVLTVEIDLETHEIVTALGPCNRDPTPEARRVMELWAKHARLRIAKWV